MTTVAQKTRIVPGMMLMGTWGHEQTNADFYKVISVSGGYAMIQGYHTERTESRPQSMCGTTMPTVPTNGRPFRRKIHSPDWAEAEFLRVEPYMTVYPWDGKPVSTSWYA